MKEGQKAREHTSSSSLPIHAFGSSSRACPHFLFLEVDTKQLRKRLGTKHLVFCFKCKSKHFKVLSFEKCSLLPIFQCSRCGSTYTIAYPRPSRNLNDKNIQANSKVIK